MLGGGEAHHLRRVKPMWSISPHAVTDDGGIIDLKFYQKVLKITRFWVGRINIAINTNTS